MKTYSNKITNTTEIEFDDVAFEVDGIEISVSGQMDVVYNYHPEEKGDWNTPTKAAYAELVKINPIFDGLEITVDSPALPASVNVSTWAHSNFHADENKTWSEYVFKHAEDILIEQAVQQLTRKFEYGDLPEIEID